MRRNAALICAGLDSGPTPRSEYASASVPAWAHLRVVRRGALAGRAAVARRVAGAQILLRARVSAPGAAGRAVGAKQAPRKTLSTSRAVCWDAPPRRAPSHPSVWKLDSEPPDTPGSVPKRRSAKLFSTGMGAAAANKMRHNAQLLRPLPRPRPDRGGPRQACSAIAPDRSRSLTSTSHGTMRRPCNPTWPAAPRPLSLPRQMGGVPHANYEVPL